MITGDLKNRIDSLWTEFWTGGITNPLTVIEQISFLIFTRLLDIQETLSEKKQERVGKPGTQGQFHFSKTNQNLRWKNFKNLAAAEMLKTVRDEVFPHLKDIAAADFADLTRRYGVELIAEKIESERHVVDILELNIGYGQGNLFGEPRAIRDAVLAEADPPADMLKHGPLRRAVR